MSDLELLTPAILAGLLVLTTHIPLGITVVKKGIIFIDLAIAQIAGMGVIFASMLGFEDDYWILQLSAISTALLGGILFSWTEKKWPGQQEPLIGISFVLAATGSVLLLTGDPHASESLKEILVGQILWVELEELKQVAIIYGCLLLAWRPIVYKLKRTGFYLIFATAITFSVQIVGVYLVFASLIIPALATIKSRGMPRIAIAYFSGMIGYISGLVISLYADLPSSPLIVWCLAISGLLAALFVTNKKETT